MKSRCGNVIASAERRVYFCRGAPGRSAVTGRMNARRVKTCILYSRQRSMCTKRDLVHRCASNFCCGASFAALLHTLAQLPGVEPHATWWRHPGPAVRLRASIRSELGIVSLPQALHKSHAKLVYTSPWPSGAVTQPISSIFCIRAIF